jgi:hypothetical protein
MVIKWEGNMKVRVFKKKPKKERSMLVGEKIDCGIMLVNRWFKIGQKNIIHPMDKMAN